MEILRLRRSQKHGQVCSQLRATVPAPADPSGHDCSGQGTEPDQNPSAGLQPPAEGARAQLLGGINQSRRAIPRSGAAGAAIAARRRKGWSGTGPAVPGQRPLVAAPGRLRLRDCPRPCPPSLSPVPVPCSLFPVPCPCFLSSVPVPCPLSLSPVLCPGSLSTVPVPRPLSLSPAFVPSPCPCSLSPSPIP